MLIFDEIQECEEALNALKYFCEETRVSNISKPDMPLSDYEEVRQAYVLCNGNVADNGHVCYVPVYMTMFLWKNPVAEKQIVRLDLPELR